MSKGGERAGNKKIVNGGVLPWIKEAAASGFAQRMQVPRVTDCPIFQEVRNLHFLIAISIFECWQQTQMY